MGFALLVGLTRGKALTYLNYVTAAGLIEHNQAKTPEARALQNERFNEGVKDLAIGFAAGKVSTLLVKTLSKAGTVIYKSFNASSIRFSQNSVNGIDEIVESMSKKGWKADAIDIVKMEDGIYTTVDNTRLLAAKKTGTLVRANAHNYNDVIPEDMAVRFANKKGELPKTWRDAVFNRVKNQNSQFRNNHPSGSFVNPTAK